MMNTPGCVVAMPVDGEDKKVSDVDGEGDDDGSVGVTDVIAAEVDSTAINCRDKANSFHKTNIVLQLR